MHTHIANGDSRLSFWPRVREFAVPPPMIESATARRLCGDWAGACAAAGIDVDLNLRALARDHGHELAARVRADLRHLAPDLLRWHMPRIAPDGLLRPGLTISLARYGPDSDRRTRGVHLVVRTPPGWAAAGQRISLALWDGSDRASGAYLYPHPHPHRRFRLDLHRHLWDARRSHELGVRSGAVPAGSAGSAGSAGQARQAGPAGQAGPADPPPWADRSAGAAPSGSASDLLDLVPQDQPCAVDRWAAEAEILLRADGRPPGAVLVRLGARHRLIVAPDTDPGDGTGHWDGDVGNGARLPGLRVARASASGRGPALPVLPDAATWVLPDLELLRAGAIDADRLHPLVAEALIPGYSSATPRTVRDPGHPRFVDCRGARHRIGLVDGVLTALDHDPDEIRREELLAALTGTPVPCLQAIDAAHRRPDCLTGVRERLHHGDSSGALAVVEDLLGAEAVLRDGALLDSLEAAARGRITYGLFRAGLIGRTPPLLCPRPVRPGTRGSRGRRTSVR
ncbi:hypothetical protein [Streptodolium elevatio]|uniref:Uncharacterized protein n=1 Tax=Streptodolium elevatio TaxID=3157996 RepID=A0ABV3DFP7_9ACTN